MLINAVSKEPFTYKDPCVQFNPHVGHDPEATAAAKQAVSRFPQDCIQARMRPARHDYGKRS